ncbi:MAG: ATPase domain-containing protein [Candidatus Bathyarchaeia archaeon]
MSLESYTSSTGIKELDELTGGGFAKGSLILVAGNPGTGKTSFSARFLYEGASRLNEAGLYVSFIEAYETFIKNMSSFKLDFKALERDKKFKFLGLSPMKKEALPTISDTILEELYSLNAKRLVIDSFSVLAQAFETDIEARMFLETLVSKIIRKLGCTTLLIVEVPIGTARIGLGLEEFVVDGIFLLRNFEFENRFFRELEVIKLRGSEVTRRKAIFSLHNGFRLFKPFKFIKPKKPKKFKPIPDSKEYFSSGSKDLDSILGGGYPRGSFNILEVGRGVPIDAHLVFELSMVCNSLANDNGVVYLPSSDITPEKAKGFIETYVDPEVFKDKVMIIGVGEEVTEKAYVYYEKGISLKEDLIESAKEIHRRERETGKPIITVIGLDTDEKRYGSAQVLQNIDFLARDIRERKSARMNVVKPSMKTTEELSDMADVHLKLIEIDGSIFLYGIKPSTCAYNVEVNSRRGYPFIGLTPVT